MITAQVCTTCTALLFTHGFTASNNSSGYTSSKHAQRALSETMRLEFHGKPVRVTDVSPGAVETEFSVVRFAGDVEAAKKVFALPAPQSCC